MMYLYHSVARKAKTNLIGILVSKTTIILESPKPKYPVYKYDFETSI